MHLLDAPLLLTLSFKTERCVSYTGGYGIAGIVDWLIAKKTHRIHSCEYKIYVSCHLQKRLSFPTQKSNIPFVHAKEDK